MFYRILWMFFVIPSCVLSASELHIRCSEPFSCGNQNDLSYPFWITGRDECGHPEYKLECNTNSGFPEVSISSVKFTILQANYPTSRIIKLARSEYITDVCPQNPLTEPFNENVLRLVSGTELLTIYYDCQEFRTSTYVGELTCDDGRSYFVTRSLSSPQLEGMSSLLNELMGSCKRNVSVPASGPALNTLQSNPSQDNFRKALREGFEVGQNRECLKCMDSGDACGYNQTLGGFVCYCIDGGACRSRNKGLSSEARAGIGFASAFMGTTVIAGGLLCVLRRRKTSHIQRQHNLKALIPLKRYSYAQVKKITKSFVEVVGKGGFGTVYRGTLCDGRSVAVKILKDTIGNNGEDFINEVASTSKTSHVNIVDLLGFCYEGSHRAIIYEFMENGSLDRFISGKTSMNMDLKALYGIALGVARGIEYLHHSCKARIVHFDIKPQNVLLDDNLCPKVSDFGLAKLCEKKESIMSLLDTRGTIGFIAPEVFSRMYGGVSHKSDVYSYGMLILEMIGARNKERTTQNSGSNTSSVYFPEWIYKDLEKRDTERLIENGITCEEEEIQKKLTLVGLWCIQPSPSDRPPMNKVVEMIEGSVDALEVPPRPVFRIPAPPLEESSTFSEDISSYTELCSMNVA